MKKVKMLFTAATIFTVVGGALAFKSHTLSGTLKCATSSGTCPTSTDRYITTDLLDPAGVDRYCNTGVESDNNCTSALQRVKIDPK